MGFLGASLKSLSAYPSESFRMVSSKAPLVGNATGLELCSLAGHVLYRGVLRRYERILDWTQAHFHHASESSPRNNDSSMGREAVVASPHKLR